MRHANKIITATATAILALPVGLHGQSPEDVAKGAEVWAGTCMRCHNARPSAERTDAQWVTIVNHMRARANLTRTQARSVTVFLQATNLPEGPTANLPTPPQGEASGEVGEGGGQPEAAEAGEASAEVTEPSGEVTIDPEVLDRLRAYLRRILDR